MQHREALLRVACREFVRRSFRRHVAPALVPSIGVLFAALAYFLYLGPALGAWIVGSAMVLALGFWSYVWIVHPTKVASRLLPAFLSTDITPTAAGVEVNTNSQHVVVPWGAVIWRYTHPDFHLLALSPLAFLVVRTAGLSSQAAQLIEART